MGTQEGLDFCKNLLFINRGFFDKKYPLIFTFLNKSNIPGRPESIGIQNGNLSKQIKMGTNSKLLACY